MSYSMILFGRDKEKLKAAIRAQQCQDEEKNPHSGVPVRVADHLCSEIDRVRIYEYAGKSYGLRIEASGSFHEQGCNHTESISSIQIVE